jgi:hypothetical protein
MRADGDRQRRNDRQSQRHAQGHAGPRTRRAVDLDDAANPLDVGADHVHADTAAGDRRDLLRSRQPGLEDQRQLLARAELGRIFLFQETGVERLGYQLLAVDAAPVVFDIDEDLVARLARRYGEDPDLPLAGLQPVGRHFDPVIHRVADDVRERIADHLDHLAVELDVAAFDIDEHLLAKLRRKVADHARQSHEEVLDPLHARAGDRIAHFGDDRAQPLERATDRDLRRRFTKAAGKLVARQHHVRNRAHDAVEKLDGEPDGARGRAPSLVVNGRCCRRRSALRARLQRVNQIAVIAFGQFRSGFDRRNHLPDAVNDGEHGADQRRVRLAAAGADIGKRILGRVAQRLEPWKLEEAAIPFDGVDEPENGIEPCAVVGIRFPGDDLAAQRLEHFPRLRDEIGNQVVHWRSCSQSRSSPALWRAGVNAALALCGKRRADDQDVV